MKAIRFTGKFKELIPDGWKFQKLYARNYRQYSKNAEPNEPYSQSTRIWQHLGGYVEIDDLYSDSWQVVDFILSGMIEKAYNSFSEDYRFHLDLENRVLQSHTHEIRAAFYSFIMDETKSEEEKKEYTVNFYKKWREIYVAKGTVKNIRDLLEKDWIKITDAKGIYKEVP